jgi:hypothetical protein
MGLTVSIVIAVLVGRPGWRKKTARIQGLAVGVGSVQWLRAPFDSFRQGPEIAKKEEEIEARERKHSRH